MIQYQLKQKKRLAAELLWLVFEPIDDAMRFEAGQYVSLRVSLSDEPLFLTIAAMPDASGCLHFLLRFSADDAFLLPYLSQWEAGAPCLVSGPFGSTTISHCSADQVVLLSVGTGISQAKVILDAAIERSDQRVWHLYWSGRIEEQPIVEAWMVNWQLQLAQFNGWAVGDVGQLPMQCAQVLLDKLVVDCPQLKEFQVVSSGPPCLAELCLARLADYELGADACLSDYFTHVVAG